MTVIRIKRSSTPGAVPALEAGEFAVNLVDKRLFTANSTDVFDAFQQTSANVHIQTNSSAISFRVGNSTVNSTFTANSLSIANSTVTLSLTRPTAAQRNSANYFLNSNSQWIQIVGGANNQLQFNNNGVLAGSAGFTVNASSNTLSVANTIQANSLYFQANGNIRIQHTSANNLLIQTPNTLSINCNTVNSSIIYTGQQNFLVANVTSSGGTISWPVATAQVARYSATQHSTLAAPTGAVQGGTYVFIFKQHASSSFTLGFNVAYKFPDGEPPTASPEHGAVDIMTCVYENGVMNCVYQNRFG